ncbi:MAG: hypothetical protein FWC16_03100 [Defluviitaleaceae bacterium]|nr:hypothetical protein [Defluviitaleaceae bacterium]MCL2273889.1 hypothetical protein [Defluviitaleaceae bacterium]
MDFPRTTVAGISLPRMIMGTNWLAGWSHRSPSADNHIKMKFADASAVLPVLLAYLENDIDAIMAPMGLVPAIYDAVKMAEDKTGKKIIIIDTPMIDVNDTTEGRVSALASIKRCKELGATFCLPHHSSVEELVDKNARKIRRIDDYTKMIRDNGMIPGLSAHMPELITYSDDNGYDVETYIQIYNCLGFLMQIEIETIASIIHNAKKPVMTIKPMAAGRCTPYVGLNFAWATLRKCDMVTVGAHLPQEVYENIEISRAFFEGRYPDLEKRASPNMNQSAFG